MKFIISLFAIITFSKAFAISPPPVIAKHNMVVTSQHLATEVGLDILKQGGNAIDAAVAVGYALAVVHPCCGNLGGGGFMTLHLANGKNTFLNYREIAPQAIRGKYFFDSQGQLKPEATVGYLGVGIPGTVAGLEYARSHYGKLSRQADLAPAIELAQKGYVLTKQDADYLAILQPYINSNAKIREIFSHEGNIKQAGDRLIQKDLANTLMAISLKGPDVFYKGKIAKVLANASTLNQGYLKESDFAQYHITEEKPISCEYRGYQVIAAPPPSSGGVTLCEILNIVKAYPLSQLGYHSAQTTHYNVEAMRYAYADRNTFLGDPAFVKNPIQWLLSVQHAENIRDQIKKNQASSSKQLPLTQPPEGQHTTHYSIMDDDGNAVSVTTTLNSFFGAKVIAGDSGFFLNNELNDFALKVGLPNQFQLVQGKANLIAPGKRPLSSMTPTILLKNNQPKMIVGSPGGSTIITTVLQVIQNILDFGLDIQAAVDGPRYHMQWLPDQIFMEPLTFSADTQKKLKTMGYHLTKGSVYHTRYWGAANAIWINGNQMREGGADNRRSAGTSLGN